MATKTTTKFGVVHTSPANLIKNAASLESGKLYFAAGNSSGIVKQGIYGVIGVTTDGSIDIDGTGSGKQLAMFATGAVADGSGYGLSQYNFDSNALTKLNNLHDASSSYLPKNSYVQVSKTADGYVPKADGTAGTIDSQNDDWVLTFNGSSVDWHKLPANAFKNDNSIYTGTAPINVSGTSISHAASGVTAGRYGDTSSGRTLAFGDKFKVVDVSVNEFGHVTKAASYELTLPSKPETAGTADEAKKTTGTLTIKGNGTQVETFNGSDAAEVNIKSGNTSTLTVTGTSDGSITIAPVTAAVNLSSNALTTGAQVASYVSTQLGNLTGALLYKGTVSTATELNSKAKTQGHVWISSTKDWKYTDVNNQEYEIEVGDMFICNGTGWNIVNSEFDVSTYDNPLSWGTDVSIAVVDGVTIKAKLPANPNTDYQATKDGHYTPSAKDASVTATASGNVSWGGAVVTGITKDSKGHITGVTTSTIPGNPNTDEKVKANISTGKFYLIGQDDSTNGTIETTYKNASVYVDGGYLFSGGAKVLTDETYKGTVTSITPGTGLTNGTTETAITSTGTLNLKIASSSEIGGVKPGETVASNKIYGVQVHASTGAMTVNVPWTNDNTWRDVYVGTTQILSNATNSGSLKFVNGTNITATWNSSNKTIQFDASGLATDTEVATAKSEAIEAATIYWETL